MAESGGSALFQGSPLWGNIILTGALVTVSAYFAGTTLGVLSLDRISLQIIAKASDDKKERKHASEFLSCLSQTRVTVDR